MVRKRPPHLGNFSLCSGTNVDSNIGSDSRARGRKSRLYTRYRVLCSNRGRRPAGLWGRIHDYIQRPFLSAGKPWRCRQYPRRARRDADRQSPWPAGEATALARLHQLDQEHDGDRATRLPQRETMAKYCDGIALDRRWHIGGGQRIPSIESLEHLPALRAALAAHQSKCVSKRVEDNADVA